MTTGEKSGRERTDELGTLSGEFDVLWRTDREAAYRKREEIFAAHDAIAADLDTLTAAREAAEEILTMMARGEWSRVRVEKLCLLLIDGGTHADRG